MTIRFICDHEEYKCGEVRLVPVVKAIDLIRKGIAVWPK